MKFRPCIDIHNGKVKQIIGGSLRDSGDHAEENFVSKRSAADYARLYRDYGLTGGHIILLNSKDSPYYEATKAQAMEALQAFPGGMQVGGGITDENAAEYLEAGAGGVIVTSFVFQNGEIVLENLKRLCQAVGREHLILDVSCRKREGAYYIVTDRWQNFTDVKLGTETLDFLSEYCSEFLVHAVDVEGKAEGIEREVARLLGSWGKLPVTYAGGVHSYEDLELLKKLGQTKVDVTIGSALDLFGGKLEFERIAKMR